MRVCVYKILWRCSSLFCKWNTVASFTDREKKSFFYGYNFCNFFYELPLFRFMLSSLIKITTIEQFSLTMLFTMTAWCFSFILSATLLLSCWIIQNVVSWIVSPLNWLETTAIQLPHSQSMNSFNMEKAFRFLAFVFWISSSLFWMHTTNWY